MHVYSDGTPAQIGDQVFGSLVNVRLQVAGIIIDLINEGSEQMNCVVAFFDWSPYDRVHGLRTVQLFGRANDQGYIELLPRIAVGHLKSLRKLV